MGKQVRFLRRIRILNKGAKETNDSVPDRIKEMYLNCSQDKKGHIFEC